MTSDFLIHIVDDEEPVRQSLSFLLAASGWRSRKYASAAEFLDTAENLEDACLITDLRMSEMNGLDLLRRLRKNGNTLPVIVVTGHGDVLAAVEAMKAGASDFIEKPFSEEVILSTLKRVCAAAQEKSQVRQQRQAARDKLESLSARERQVLDGVVNGLPNKSIAHNLGLSPRTVEVYRATIMTKMQAHSLAELVRMAVEGSDHYAARD
jgi:two-component system, LuxR family, response regulator FixJ|tara:strand:- start:118 stop:744 length:627 start_codon:yes stop_codon:yes gene_type:complete